MLQVQDTRRQSAAQYALVKPPHRTLIVETSALPAASASYGESPMGDRIAALDRPFFQNDLKMSGSGLDSSTSSDDVAASIK